jgi:hypothetical protein
MVVEGELLLAVGRIVGVIKAISGKDLTMLE